MLCKLGLNCRKCTTLHGNFIMRWLMSLSVLIIFSKTMQGINNISPASIILLFHFNLLCSGPGSVVCLTVNLLIASNLRVIILLLGKFLNGLGRTCTCVIFCLFRSLLQNIDLISLAATTKLLPLYGEFLLSGFNRRSLHLCRGNNVFRAYRACNITLSVNIYGIGPQILSSGGIRYSILIC